jgi:photosystem II stability/assembly factor-like uncharacterized protein
MVNKKLILAGLLCYGLCASAQTEIPLDGKELFGDIKARHIGPALMSGRITDLEGHPTNNKIIYAGTAGGGVWKSSNGGASFQSIFDEHPQSIGVVSLDPNNPDQVIWVGTGETWTRNSVSVGDGIFKSVDGGINWKPMGLKKSERISDIKIDPINSNVVYAGVLGAMYGDSEERGVFKSTDGGESWNKILYIDGKTGCSELVMDPKDPNTLYAAMWEFRRTGWSFASGGLNSGLYKSTDAGATWSKIHNGFPSGKLGRIAVAVAPSDSKILYAVLETEQAKDKGLYRSDDAGASWKLLNQDFGLVVRPFYFSRIVIDPKNPDILIKAGLFGSISRDGGKTFKNMGPMHSDIHDILFDKDNSDRIYAATDGGVYRTWDGGTTMEIVANIPVSQFYHVSVDNATPYNVYGGLQDNGSWYGPSASPGGIEARDWNSVGAGDGFRVLKHATKNIVYSEMQGAENVWRYDVDKNQAVTIQPLPVKGDPKLRFNWNAPMAMSVHQPDRFYMGSQFLQKSEDMGDTWQKISPDLTTNNKAWQDQTDSGGLSKDNSGAENHTTIFTIAESPKNENVIWVGTDDGNVQVTQDGGKTWKNTVANVPGLPANTWCHHIEASVHDAGTAYAVFDGHTRNDFKTYAYKTTDFGTTWTSITTPEIKGFTRSIQEDYESKDLLFLGTEFGLYVTINGGKNWSRFTNNMPATAVHYLELHKGTSDLVIATHGRGIIIIDDISPLRQLSSDVLDKDFHFFTSKPFEIKEQSGFGGTATEMEFVGQNPDTDAKITYYLKKRHTFGKMSMEVLDKDGKTLTELSPGKSKGINVVTWNFTTKQPKMAKGKTFTFGGFTSPRVLPGTYDVVVTKGKETYKTTVDVIPDKNTVLTDADRKFKNDITMEMFKMAEDLAYMVYELDEHVAFATDLASKDKGAAKVATAYANALTALKQTLVITTGDNYVEAAEPQLREKMADLYAKIASSYQKPTGSELENKALIEERFNNGKKSFEAIKAKEGKKFTSYLEKQNISLPALKTYAEFIAD